MKLQNSTIPCATYFSLIKKYLKFAPVRYFKVGSYLQKSSICSEKSMVMAHHRTWVFKSLSLEFIKQPIIWQNVFLSVLFSKAGLVDPKSFFSHNFVLLTLWNIYWHFWPTFKSKDVILTQYATQKSRFLCCIFALKIQPKWPKKICARFFFV